MERVENGGKIRRIEKKNILIRINEYLSYIRRHDIIEKYFDYFIYIIIISLPQSEQSIIKAKKIYKNSISYTYIVVFIYE